MKNLTFTFGRAGERSALRVKSATLALPLRYLYVTLTLLLTLGVENMWGADAEIIKVVLSGSNGATKTMSGTIGGTCASANLGSSSPYKLNSNGAYVSLTLASGYFEQTDIVTITGADGVHQIYYGTPTSGTLLCTTGAPSDGTITCKLWGLPANQNTIYLYRASSTYNKKVATMAVTRPDLSPTGTGTLSYTMTKASADVIRDVTNVNTITPTSTAFTTSTLSIGSNNSIEGYCGQITGHAAAYSASQYVQLGFSVASGYTFTPSAASINIYAYRTSDMKAKVVISDGATTITSNDLSCSSSSDSQITFPSGEFTGKALSGNVTITIYQWGVTSKRAYIKSPLTITGTVAAAGGGGGATTYDVNIADMTNGNVSASPSAAEEDETVTLTVTPSTGYELASLTVTGDESEDDITVTNNEFSMPAEDVTVSATFSKVNYTVSKTLTNCAVKAGSTAIPSTMQYGDDLSTIIEPTSGNLLPGSITVSGVSSYTWNALTGALTLTDVTGNVSISISAASPQTGTSKTITYNMITSGSTAATYSSSIFSNVLSGSVSAANTVVASSTMKGGNGVDVKSGKTTPSNSYTAGITSSTSDFAAGSTPYVEFRFDVVDGYTFTPTGISVPVQPISNAAYFKILITDGSSTWTTTSSSCAQGSLTTITTAPAGGSELTGTVYVRIYCYSQSSSATGYRFKTPITVTGTVAAAITSCTLTNTVNNGDYGSVSPTSVTDIPKGESTSSSTNTYTVNGTTVTATPTTSTSAWTYAFSSWSGLPATVNSDATVTANFTRTGKSYTITLDKEGGSGGSSNVSATYGSDMPSAGSAPTKSGCSFQGYWTGQAGTGTQYYSNASTPASVKTSDFTSASTLYAAWKVNTPAVDASTNVDVYGTTTLFITIPTDAEVRYTTNGDTPTPSSDFYDEDDGIEVTSGITVKAIAVRSNHITSDMLSVPFYQLSLQCLNGTCSPSSPYITKNHAYSITTNGTSGYAFRGWTIESGTGSFGSASTASTTFTMTSNGATIKAWWRLQCTITFDNVSPSATGGELGRTVYEGENTNLTTNVSIPSLDGYAFDGYFTEEDGAGEQLVSETGEWITDVDGYIDEDGKWAYDQSTIILYAKWVTASHTITGAVSPDGYGSISPAFISVTDGSTVSISDNVLTCDGKTLTASPASATSAWTYSFSSWSGVADDDVIDDDVTATANFTRTGKSYTITLDKEGGSGGSSNVSATYGSAMPSPGDAPTKDDYTFGGYYSAVGGGGTQYYTNACASARNSDFTSASTLYAKWTQSISLDSEGGSSGSSSVTATYNSATLGSITNPTKTGYTFAGWYDGDDGTGNLVINTSGVLQANVSDYTGVGGVWTSSTAQTLYAKWTANSYTITLNKGDHGAANQSASVLYDATALTSITHVTATGYDRTGYFDGSTKVLNADGSFADNDITGYITDGKWSKTADASLTAKWSAQTYTISYKDQGDNTYSGSNGGSLPTSHTYGIATDFVNGVKFGYRFMGWYTDASCTVSAGSSIGATAITANTTYYAKWAQLYTITNGEPSNGTITAVTEAIEGETVSITASPNSEYNFDAWSVYKTGDPETTISPDEATASTSFTMPAYGVTVDATFVVKTYSVTYNGNGSTGGIVPTDVTAYTSGQTVTVASGVPTMSGSTFVGWLNSTNNTIYRAGQSFTITAATTLTAQWSTPTITTYYYGGVSISNGALVRGTTSSVQFFTYANSTFANSTAITLSSTPSITGIYSNTNSVSSWLTTSNWTTSSSSNRYIQGVDFVKDGSYTLALGSKVATSIRFIGFSNQSGTRTMTVGGVGYSTSSQSTIYSHEYTKSGNFTGNVTITQDGSFRGILIITTSTPSGYNVTFNASGKSATNMPANYSGVPSGKKIAVPTEIPTVTNYIFSGWVTSSGGSTAFDFANTTISANKIIYASWVAKTAPEQYTFSLSDPCASASPSATLSGSQSGWSYQLYKDGVASGDPKAGTGNALTWTGLTAGSYYVKTVETSTQATEPIGDAATVYAATAISSNIATSRSVSANVSSIISFGASGYSLSYQWYTCNSDGTGKVAIDGKDAPLFTYTFTNSDAPTKYICCVATGTCGTVTSNIQTVTITPTYLLTYDANGGNGAPAAAYRAATTAALSSTQPTRSNHRFLGWNTEDDGSGTHYAAGASFPMPAEATTLYAEWQEVASLQWVPNLNTAESSIGTASKSSAYTTRIPTSAMSAISNYGSLTITSSAKSDLTSKIQAPTSYDAGKYMYVTFTVPANYEFVPSSVSVKVQPVDGAGDVQLELCDANGHSISKTQSSVASGSSTTITMTNDLGVALNGTVTLKIYCYGGSTGTYRLGSPIAISGDVNYECPERPTVTTPASVQNINVGAYDKQTLTVAATPYADGALSYQWMKDGVEIDGATSTTYVVDASTIGFGATAAYTCVVTEEGACAPAVSPAYNLTVPVLVTQPIRVGGSSSWNGDGSAAPDMTFNDPTSTLTQNAVITWTGYTFTATNVGKSKDGQEDATDKFTGVPTSSTKDADYYLSLKFNSPSHNVRIAEVNVPIMAVTNNVTVQVTVSDGTTTVTSEALTATQTSAGTVRHLQFTFSSTPFILNAGTIELRIYVYNQSSDTGFRLGTPVTINGGVLTDYEYTGAGADANWSTAANWNWGKLPLAGDNVVLQKPVTVDNTDAVANNVVIDKSGGNTGKLTIAADGMLIAGGTIRANGDAQTAVEDVVINTSKTSQGALIFDNPSGSKQTKGTVNFYTRSYRDNTSKKLQWQYVGVPFDDVTDEVYGGLYVNKYSETAGSWTVMRYQGDRSISAWDGLALAGDDEGYASISGTFTSTEDKDITLTHSAAAGENLIGNSWTAPIQIADLAESDFDGATATIYLFNTGRYKTSEGSGSSTDVGTKEHTAGQWMTIPINSAASGVWAGMKVIPAFNAFEVITSSEATLSLDYSKVVASATNDVNAEMRAPVRRTSAKDIDGYRLRVADELTYTDMYLFEDITFTTGHDNGWDGDYMPCDGRSAQLYAQTALGKLAVAALPDLEGTVLGFKPGQSTEYTFSFGTNAGGYYLNDLKMQESTLIQEGNTYTFNWEDGDSTNRFIISATPYKMPTGVDEVQGDKVQSDKVRKVLIDDHLYIIRAGKIFDATGGRIK